MKCPFCRIDNDKVIETRTSTDGTMIRRRRQCLGCNKRFSTQEHVEKAVVRVIKRDGTRVPFDRAKLRAGLDRACWKRSISDDDIWRLVATVEAEIDATFDEVESRIIGELVMDALRELDHVAYVRFASVYHRFQSVSDFASEIEAMAARSPRTLQTSPYEIDHNGCDD
ncbi:MAG: transcriptional regulator NrdR [Thermoguttaceae bacterium]